MNLKNATTLLTLTVIGLIIAVPILWYIFTGIGVRNTEATLRAQFVAVQNANKVDYDAMWKIISSTAEVPTQYSNDFKDAYSTIIASGQNTDSNSVKSLFAVATGMRPPQLDSSLYRKVQDVIESERTKFANSQKQQLDVKREHDKLRTTFPSSLFVGGVAPLEVKLVTSSKTEKAFETGKDDDVSIYNKEKK